MSTYTAHVTWERGAQEFTGLKYSRRHLWRFDGGVEVPASSSPAIVPPPASDPTAVDPEEALMASLASCHMLWFLAIAAKRGFVIDRYEDSPVGVMERDAAGRNSITRVTLKPKITFSGAKQPTADELDAMHHKAHEECNIANSVKSEVTVEPVT